MPVPPAHNAKPWPVVYCQQCSKRMVPRDNERKHTFAKKQYCDKACMFAFRAGEARPKHNGPRHTEPLHEQQLPSARKCPACDEPLRRRRSETEGQYAVRAYCGAPCFKRAREVGLANRAMLLGSSLRELL